MKYFSQMDNLSESSKYSKSDILSLFGTISLDVTSDDILEQALGIYANINANGNMKRIEVLGPVANWSYDKGIALNSGSYIGHGVYKPTNTSILALYGQEQRQSVTRRINNTDNSITEDLPFYNLKEYNELYNQVKDQFELEPNVLILGQGNDYTVTEIFVKNNISIGEYQFYSLCINPGRNLLLNTYTSHTTFYFYDNPRSNFIPEELYPLKLGTNNEIGNKVNLYLPLQTNYVSFIGGDLPVSDMDKTYPIFLAYNYKSNHVNTGSLELCQNFYKFGNMDVIATLPNYNKAAIPGDNFDTVARDLCKLIVKNYMEGLGDSYTVTTSTSRNIVMLKDSNNNLLIFCNKLQQQVYVTGDLVDIVTNGVSYKIDYSYQGLKNKISTDFNSIKSTLQSYINANPDQQVIILGVNSDIHVYLHVLYENVTLPSDNTYVISLGLSSITKGFNGFNSLGVKDSKVINIFNDLVILKVSKNVYSNYDNIEADILYDINTDDQICLNTIFGYYKYLGSD